MAVQFEYNRFFPNVNGDKGEHIKAICDTFEELKVAMGQVNSLFQIDPEDVPFEDRPPAQTPKPFEDRPPAQTPKTDEVRCGFCTGPVWDNRAKKAAKTFKPMSPDFSCKDKKCGAVMWLTADGEHGEWKK